MFVYSYHFQFAYLLLAYTFLGNHRVLGQSGGASSNIEDLIDGTSGIAYNGVNAEDRAGWAVSSAGDINGDGIKDLLIGAPRADANGDSDAGQVYIVFGSNVTPIPLPTFDLNSLDGNNGFAINGINQNDRIGLRVASGGDINHDGIDDIVIATPTADLNGVEDVGQVHVVFGSNSTPWGQSFDLSELNGINGFTINGTGANDNMGDSVSSDGDVNGDGVDDLIIGSPGFSPNGIPYVGRVYIIWGSTALGSSPFNLTNLTETFGAAVDGNQKDGELGYSVSSGGDVNGDGVNDIVLAAPYADANGMDAAGQVHVLFGSNTTSSSWFNISNLTGTNGFTLNGISANAETGYSVASNGDVNGDGISDLVIGTYQTNEAFVVFGANGTWPSQFNLSDLDNGNAKNGFVIREIDADDDGSVVASGGDVNGDNIDDLVIGARRADPFNNGRGAVYVVYGRRPSDSWAASLSLTELNGTNGFRLNGIEYDDYAGRSVSLGGDVNGDNITDIVIGADGADPNGKDSGQVYVIYGQPPPTPAPTTEVCHSPQCCEAECCGNQTTWSPKKGCYRNTTSSGWDGVPLANGCAIRVCCESDCCGRGTWYSAIEASCVTLEK